MDIVKKHLIESLANKKCNTDEFVFNELNDKVFKIVHIYTKCCIIISIDNFDIRFDIQQNSLEWKNYRNSKIYKLKKCILLVTKSNCYND
jgi:hypothetical protein